MMQRERGNPSSRRPNRLRRVTYRVRVPGAGARAAPGGKNSWRGCLAAAHRGEQQAGADCGVGSRGSGGVSLKQRVAGPCSQQSWAGNGEDSVASRHQASLACGEITGIQQHSCYKVASVLAIRVRVRQSVSGGDWARTGLLELSPQTPSDTSTSQSSRIRASMPHSPRQTGQAAQRDASSTLSYHPSPSLSAGLRWVPSARERRRRAAEGS